MRFCNLGVTAPVRLDAPDAHFVVADRDRFLHSPVTLHTRRYCFPSHSNLGEVLNYGYALGEGYYTY